MALESPVPGWFHVPMLSVVVRKTPFAPPTTRRFGAPVTNAIVRRSVVPLPRFPVMLVQLPPLLEVDQTCPASLMTYALCQSLGSTAMSRSAAVPGDVVVCTGAPVPEVRTYTCV